MDDYARQLADAVAAVLPAWLERCVVVTARRQAGGVPEPLATAAREMAVERAPTVLTELNALLETDVDAQRTNPLSVLRHAVRYPTALLRAHAIPVPKRDEFATRSFPDDVYGLSPATWTDIDESLHEPGLIWGAWKAKTVLDRRRQKDRPGGLAQ